MASFATLFHPGLKSVDKSEYDQTTSEFATAYDDQGLDYGVECEYDQSISDLNKSVEDQYDQIISDLKKFVSDLNKRAEDQCNQIISELKKAAEIDPGYAEACGDRGRAYDDKGEYNFTELQKDYTQMKTIKHFRLHIETCDIYAIEQWPDGRLVGSCGPLAEDDLKDLNSYDYSDEQNNWVQKNIDRLILWFP